MINLQKCLKYSDDINITSPIMNVLRKLGEKNGLQINFRIQSTAYLTIITLLQYKITAKKLQKDN